MSRLKARPRADHQVAASQARQMPGQWVLAGTYNSTQSAMGVARQVRAAGSNMPFYRPAGAFDARHELTEDGVDLWVRYVAAPSAADFRESIEAGFTEDLDAFSRRLGTAPARRTP
ncbi:hypothetical protein [Streptomyces sp. NPDC054940]